jgi:endonuclease/exonuclease/phosphatase family metal-dependent hydrolase
MRGPMLRICSWNINFGIRLEAVLEAVSGHEDFGGLDLLALQEASVHDGLDDARAVAAALGPTYDCHQVAAQSVKGRLQANAVIWNTKRVRIDRTDSILLPKASSRALAGQQRNAVVLEGSFDGFSLLAYSAHLDISGLAHKRRQLAHVLEDRRIRAAADITVVAGDLNTFHLARWPSWGQLARAYEAEGFADMAASTRWTHTLPALAIRQKLDWLLVRSIVVRCGRSWTLPSRASDHIPLFVDLEPS